MKRHGGPGPFVNFPSICAMAAILLLLAAAPLFAEPAVEGYVWIPGGTFIMGSNDPDANAGQKPAHSVTVSGFYLGVTEVTRGQWATVMGTTPWLEDDGTPKEGVNPGATPAEDDAYPASYISWTQAMAYCAALNTLEGKNLFRLPTEAEWEYAARVGNLGSLMPFSPEIDENNLGDYAWFNDNTVDAGEAWPHAVKQKLPTRWSGAAADWLYDIHGNVSEWVLDYYGSYSSSAQTNPSGPTTGTTRILRGGYFEDRAYMPMSVSDCSSGNRNPVSPSATHKRMGLRVLRQLNPYTYLPGQGGSSGGGTVVVTPSSSEGGGGGGCFIQTIISR